MDKFYEGLESQKFIGIKCPTCNKVYFPPRKVCGDCFKTIPLEDANLVDLATTGTLINFTATNYAVSERRKKKSEKTTIIGLIKIDGSDTAIITPVLETQESDINIGMKVEVVWDKKPVGSPDDIKGFKPAGGT